MMKLYKLLIIDDNHSEEIKSSIEDSLNETSIDFKFEFTLFSSIIDASRNIRDHEKIYDLTILDYELDTGSCFDLLEKVNKDKLGILVFASINQFRTDISEKITSEGIELYYHKPASNESAKEFLFSLRDYLESLKNLALGKVLINYNNHQVILSTNDILYIQANNGNATICFQDNGMPDSVTEPNVSLKTLEERFDGTDIVRCHDSYLVNLSKIKSIQTVDGKICAGFEIPKNSNQPKYHALLNTAFKKRFDLLGFKLKKNNT